MPGEGGFSHGPPAMAAQRLVSASDPQAVACLRRPGDDTFARSADLTLSLRALLKVQLKRNVTSASSRIRNVVGRLAWAITSAARSRRRGQRIC